jgi:hypothetical protein
VGPPLAAAGDDVATARPLTSEEAGAILGVTVKTFKRLAVVAVLTSLGLGLAPKPVVCQMSKSSSAVCRMACCKKTQKTAPACPLMKPAAPAQVAIVVAPLVVVPAMKVVAVVSLPTVVALLQTNDRAALQPQIPKRFFGSSPQIGPATPTLA